MRGLATGEQSSSSNPILQLFCRSAGFLADLDNGTFLIEDIHDPDAAASTVVASTPFAAGHKLGTGRYVIPTGATTLWSQGTHRAVCTYQMAAGGPTYKQIIEFEVLDEVAWPTGFAFKSYVSTRQCIADGVVGASYSLTTAQRFLDLGADQIEQWTGRHFEPRYLHVVREGQEHPTLFLNEAIIALEDVYSIWQTTSGTDTYKYEQYLYKVFNRHLDGYTAEDDRYRPRLTLTAVDGVVAKVTNFAWPSGNQNIQLRGVFGFTDPMPDYAAGQVNIGRTPNEIAYVNALLLSRFARSFDMGDMGIHQPGRVKSARTDQQAIAFASNSGSSAFSTPSGDPIIDNILRKYRAPLVFAAV